MHQGIQEPAEAGRHARARRVGLRALAGAALLALSACSTGVEKQNSVAGPPPAGGDLFTTSTFTQSAGAHGATVAQLELAAPSRGTFVLHGTVPVPKGTYPRPDGLEPFSVLDHDGTLAATQVEIVSRYPQDFDGADVVEVLARVSLPPGTAPGTRVTYSVVEHAHPKGPMAVRPEVLALISAPSSVVIKARDCFGHSYELDLLRGMRQVSPSSRILRKGRAAVQMRNYGVMHPTTSNVGAPDGALPHFLGVHSYMTAWALDHALSLDLRFNNGPDGHDPTTSDDNPLGKVYFESLELWVPSGWTVHPDVQDPNFGAPYQQGGHTVYPLVKPTPNGRLHVIGPRAQFHRRLSLAKVGRESDAQSLAKSEGQAFVRRGFAPGGNEYYSWWNHQTPGYFPQRQRLPDLSHVGHSTLRSQAVNNFHWIRNHLQSTTAANYPHETAPLGWARPWGNAYGGMTGGSEIYLYDGVELAEAASNEGYRAVQMTHRMYTDRQPMALYGKDGDPTVVEKWITHGPSFDYVNIIFFLVIVTGPDPFGFNVAPQYQADWVASQGKQPEYEGLLSSYKPIDFAHYIRYTRSPKVLAWLGNDALAKDDLMLAADVFRLSYHGMRSNSSGYVMSTQLISDVLAATNNPGKGLSFGRQQSWGIDAVCAAHSLAPPDWRAATIPWAQVVSDTVYAGQSACNGIIQSVINNKLLNAQFRARQSIEQAITENALMSLRKSVLEGVDQARAQQLSLAAMKSTAAMIGPLAWSPTLRAPLSVIAVAPLAGEPYCSGLPPGGGSPNPDTYQTWSSFGYGYQLSGDPIFLQRAQEMSGSSNLLGWLQSQGTSNIHNRAALLATLQQ